jgi:rhamnulokinase
MNQKQAYIALDCGAESARVMVGILQQGRLQLEEIHRFPTGSISMGDSLRWNVLQIFEELRTGVCKAVKLDLPIASLSADSWGLDFVLIRKKEPILTTPRHYRDPRNLVSYEKVRKQLGEDFIFEETGIQFMPINTLYQLAAAQEEDPELLRFADKLVPMGDWFNYMFSGLAVGDASMVSTTQLYNPFKQNWSEPLIQSLRLPRDLFPKIVPCGSRLGPITEYISETTGLSKKTQVITTCSHDTGAAVVGTPAESGQKDWAYLSSGTWSLLGVELDTPVITSKSRQYNFTNEVGLNHSIRLLKNISGLWVLQECRRKWESEGQSYDYSTLAQMALAASSLRSMINPNDPRFTTTGEMPEKIAGYCVETHQSVPENHGAFVRSSLESLALSYRKVLDELEDTTGITLRTLHIVGGGSKNKLLNQLAANATGRRVLSGPSEATAIGNVLIQGLALGHLNSLSEIRDTVRNSCEIEEYLPQDQSIWKGAYQRFLKLP